LPDVPDSFSPLIMAKNGHGFFIRLRVSLSCHVVISLLYPQVLKRLAVEFSDVISLKIFPLGSLFGEKVRPEDLLLDISPKPFVF